jgi:5-methylcytosine-specific restriction protein A
MARLPTLKTRLSAAPASPVQQRVSARERGYTHRWEMARARFLRSHPMCVMCEAQGRVEVATVVDHIIPHRGDQELFWRESNWQALCATHHNSHKQRQEHAAGLR